MHSQKSSKESRINIQSKWKHLSQSLESKGMDGIEGIESDVEIIL